MTYEEYLDEVTTLITEKFEVEDDEAIRIVMSAQADNFFTLHDDNPKMCNLDLAHKEAKIVYNKYK